MFYRRKVILALLEAFDGQLPKISLQKLLFLFTKRQSKPEYDFVPYRYGCFSFSANADLDTMVKQGLLVADEKLFIKKDTANYISKLKEDDKRHLVAIYKLYEKSSASSLMKMTYLNYQYYAINSLAAKEILNEEQYEKVLRARPLVEDTILYTIGYEGISLEEYLNRLIRNDVRVLVDVRSNALSMKYGFSKSQLNNFCNKLNIEYIHIPEVGIQSDQRQQLNTQADYDKLFVSYNEINLSETALFQKNILDLLIEKKRIALTCFEANICQCHRTHLAVAIEKLPGFKFSVKHI